MTSRLLLLARFSVTLIVVLAALIGARWMWIHYQVEPWTRDGRVRADVVEVSPDISALITAVDVGDNGPVRKGQRLFTLDQPRYRVAVEQADAAVLPQRAALAEARRENARNRGLGDLLATETTEQGESRVASLEAAVAQAAAVRDAARLNLPRTVVYWPVDGVVANATLHPGDYAAAGRPVLGLVDDATLHVDGYFEETKLARIRVGDPVTVELVGDPRGYRATSPASRPVSRIVSGPPAATCCRTSTRRSAGCVWRNGYRCASPWIGRRPIRP